MPARKRYQRDEHEHPREVLDEVGATERDYVMARLAAARVAAMDAVHAIDEATGMFVHVDEDPKGKKRGELIQASLEALGDASRAMESADEMMEEVDPKEVEPWEDDNEDDDQGENRDE